MGAGSLSDGAAAGYAAAAYGWASGRVLPPPYAPQQRLQFFRYAQVEDQIATYGLYIVLLLIRLRKIK